jgi:hypothetical protein
MSEQQYIDRLLTNAWNDALAQEKDRSRGEELIGHWGTNRRKQGRPSVLLLPNLLPPGQALMALG